MDGENFDKLDDVHSVHVSTADDHTTWLFYVFWSYWMTYSNLLVGLPELKDWKVLGWAYWSNCLVPWRFPVIAGFWSTKFWKYAMLKRCYKDHQIKFIFIYTLLRSSFFNFLRAISFHWAWKLEQVIIIFAKYAGNVLSQLLNTVNEIGAKYTFLYISDPFRSVDYLPHRGIERFLAEGTVGNGSTNSSTCDEVCQIKSSLLEGLLVVSRLNLTDYYESVEKKLGIEAWKHCEIPVSLPHIIPVSVYLLCYITVCLSQSLWFVYCFAGNCLAHYFDIGALLHDGNWYSDKVWDSRSILNELGYEGCMFSGSSDVGYLLCNLFRRFNLTELFHSRVNKQHSACVRSLFPR